MHDSSLPAYSSSTITALLTHGLLVVLLTAPATSQTTPSTQSTTPAKTPDSQSVTSVQSPQNEDIPPPPPHNPNASPAEKADEAWSMLLIAVSDPKHVDLRVQALAALGTLAAKPRGVRQIVHAMDDKDLDVRTAAILAAGQTKDRSLTTNLRTMLDDKEPQVAFAAAITLWKMNDRSGEDILLAVADGERSANPTMINGTRQNINRSLRHPGQLARFGAMEGAALLLGPFGFGITAYEYMRKNGGDSGRVSAIEELSQQKTGPIREKLIDALADKDVAVRAAAAKALGSYREQSVSDALFNSFTDPKPPVRLTAAAAYINSTEPTSTRRKPAKQSVAFAPGS